MSLVSVPILPAVSQRRYTCVRLKHELSIAVYIRKLIHSCLEHHSPDSAAERLRSPTHRVAKYGRSMAKSGWSSLGGLGSRLLMRYACWARCYLAIAEGLAEPLTVSSGFINFSKNFATRGAGLDVLTSLGERLLSPVAWSCGLSLSSFYRRRAPHSLRDFDRDLSVPSTPRKSYIYLISRIEAAVSPSCQHQF